LDLFAQELRRSPDPPSTDIEREGDRQMNAWRNFIRSDLPKRLESNLKVGVRPPLLERWLGERLVSRCIRIDGSDLSMSQVQQIVDSLLPEVPVERQRKPPNAGLELLVVDRDAFALELARQWVRSGLPRSPVR